jgi:hypothetical protein
VFTASQARWCLEVDQDGLWPARCDLRDCLNRYQEGHLPYPQKAPCADLRKAHLALLLIDEEILQAAYALPFCVVGIFADRPLNG